MFNDLRPQVARGLGEQVGVLEGVQRPRLGRRPGHPPFPGMDDLHPQRRLVLLLPVRLPVLALIPPRLLLPIAVNPPVDRQADDSGRRDEQGDGRPAPRRRARGPGLRPVPIVLRPVVAIVLPRGSPPGLRRCRHERGLRRRSCVAARRPDPTPSPHARTTEPASGSARNWRTPASRLDRESDGGRGDRESNGGKENHESHETTRIKSRGPGRQSVFHSCQFV